MALQMYSAGQKTHTTVWSYWFWDGFKMFSVSFKAGTVFMLAVPDTDLFCPHRTVGFLFTEHAVKLWLFIFILYINFFVI